MIECLPLRNRKTLLKSFLISVGTMFNYLLQAVTDWKDMQKWEMSITPQVFSLEAALNKLFDPAAKRIHIGDAERVRGNFYFRATDNKQWFHKNTFYWKERKLGYDTDFIVFCPSSVESQEEQIRGTIDKYKLVGKKYTISYE
jgi:hypothetical protein